MKQAKRQFTPSPKQAQPQDQRGAEMAEIRRIHAFSREIESVLRLHPEIARVIMSPPAEEAREAGVLSCSSIGDFRAFLCGLVERDDG